MIQIPFKNRAIRKDISDSQVLCVRMSQHKYIASVLDKETMEVDYSNAYAKASALNKYFLSKYGVELMVNQ